LIPSCVGLSGRTLWRSGENATELDLNYPLDRGTTMRTSTARSQRSWEPHTMFVCFALLAAASFEIQGLVKDLQSVSAREQSEFQSDARSGGENDQSSRPEELTSRNHDESEKGGSDPSLLQATGLWRKGRKSSQKWVYFVLWSADDEPEDENRGSSP
jgi:hypothetical protein